MHHNLMFPQCANLKTYTIYVYIITYTAHLFVFRVSLRKLGEGLGPVLPELKMASKRLAMCHC